MLEHFVSTWAALAEQRYTLTGFQINEKGIQKLTIVVLLDIVEHQADISEI